MTMRPPSDFSTYKEALEYANTRLDELRKNIRETLQEIESETHEMKEHLVKSIVLLKELKEAQT